MKRFILTIIWVGLLMAASPAHAEVTVFACEPEWGALAEEIGGDKVEVKEATSAAQDTHHVSAKPSLIAKIRQADLVICSGAGLEIGWLPVLLSKAGSEQVQPGNPGNLMAADYVTKLEVPDHVDRSMGDVHPDGNPHIHLNPYNIGKAAKELTNRLTKIDADNASFYRDRFAAFDKRWQANISRWEAQAKNLRGMPIVVHHKAWTYLADWLKLNIVASLEPKPGIPPSVSHLESVLEKVRQTRIKAIVRTPYESGDASEWLADKTGEPALELPFTVGGNDKVTDLQSLFDQTLKMLEDANAR